MKRVAFGMLVGAAALGLAASASAICSCGDRAGCGDAPGCADKSPGDGCGRARSCKIVVGTVDDSSCCCGCSRGLGPKACNYGTIGDVDLPADVACGSAPLGKLTARTESAVNADLEHADAACRDERNALKKANAARGRLARLRKKIREASGKTIDDACAAGSVALIEAVRAKIDDVEAGNAPGGPATTTSTVPGGPHCSASFVAVSDPEVDFWLGCFAAGTTYEGFQLTLTGGRQVTNFLEPPGFVCTIATESAGNDSLKCVGNFTVDEQVMGGRIRTIPAPVPSMDASLFVQVGDWRYGPFATSGP